MVKYENDQKAAMVANAEVRDRAAIHRQAIADFGGKPIAQFGSYGEYDMVYIYEMPDDKALAANLHLTDSFGLAKYSKTVPLMESGDFVASLALAAGTETRYGPAKVD
jgi:uncharacterized protein with GYD domain